MYLYHYTSKSALHQILDDGIVYMSDKDREGTNHRHGPGVYLTSLSPENTIKKLKQNNFDGYCDPKITVRLQAYLKFDIEDLEVSVEKVETKGDRDVRRYPKNIDLSKISYYYNEDTSSGSQGEIFKQPASLLYPQHLYHYTSKYALHHILYDRIVYKSDEDREDTNHRYGPGVYLTSLSPENTTKKLQQNNRDGLRDPRFADRQQSYLKFDFEDLEPYVEKVGTKGNRDVWRYSKNIDLSKISYYYNEDTSSGSEGEIFKQPNLSKTSYYYNEDTSSESEGEIYGQHAAPSLHYAEMYSRQNSSQLQQQQEESGTFGATVGIAAAVGILGAAALGLFAYSRRNNNQQ